MKECKHQTDAYEAALEQIEQMIERIDPDVTIHISDITGRIKLADQGSEITKATIMLLKKYGIEYQEDSDGRSNRATEKRRCFHDLCQNL